LTTITAAMNTAAPTTGRPFFKYGRICQPSTRATSLMIHVERLGPRRVYRHEWTGRYFCKADGRRRYLDDAEVLRLSRREITNE
jgi:hypothetical protein